MENYSAKTFLFVSQRTLNNKNAVMFIISLLLFVSQYAWVCISENETDAFIF